MVFVGSDVMFKRYRVLFICLFTVLFLGLSILSFFLFRKDFVFSIPNYTSDLVDVNSEFVIPEVNACYGNRFKCRDISVDVSSNVDTSLLGDYEVVYSVDYKGHHDSIVKIISVVDNVNPEILTGVDQLSVCPNSSEYEFEYNAYDNYDGDLTGDIVKNVHDDFLTLSVSDSSGNVSEKNISILREDLDSPSISLSGNSTVYVLVGSSFSEPGYYAYDNCDGDITGSVVVTGSVNTSTVGNYYINYSVVDGAGNSTSVSRKVSVYEPTNDGSHVVYLTFDDGPSKYTGELLDILAKYNVKATFFVTNINSSYSYYIKQAYEQGHTIALHTSSHNYSTVYASVDAYFNDLSAINETVKNMTGSYSKLVRFPGGSSNTVSRNYSTGIMTSLSKMLEERGYKYFDWNVSSGDASGTILSPSQYANNIINGLGNGSYYIVLQHDTNINSIRSVETVIEYGMAHGYTFKALDINSPTIHHKIAN